MAIIEFTKEEKEIIIGRIQLYFNEELEQKIGKFDAEFLLDFFSEEVGTYYYNRGLYDAQTILESKLKRSLMLYTKLKNQRNFPDSLASIFDIYEGNLHNCDLLKYLAKQS